VTPFDWTNRRLHSAAASFLVIFAEGFLKWTESSSGLRRTGLLPHHRFAEELRSTSARTMPHYRISMQSP
jgi:hypothetical protein